MNMLRTIFLATALSIPLCANAAGYTTWAVPTQMELVNGGLLIHGAFGDAGNCGVANHVFVQQTSSVYKDITAMTMAAIVSGREMMFYIGSCTSVTFHWSGNVINLNLDGQGAFLR